MAATSDVVKNKLQKKEEGKLAGTPMTLEDEVKKFIQKYKNLIPAAITPERMMGIVLNEYRSTVKLRECTPMSFYGGVIKALQLGLELGPLQHCYLLPFKNGRTGRYEVQFILGYRGMIELVRRSGQILSIEARPVYDGDNITISYGLEDKFEHIPYHQIDGADKGKLKGVSLKVKFVNGGYLTDYMPLCEIEEHRSRSLAKDSGPWKTDYEAMALKTIIRKNFRWLPVSTEIQRAIAANDEAINRITPDDNDIEVDFEQIPHEAESAPTAPKEPPQEQPAGEEAPLFTP